MGAWGTYYSYGQIEQAGTPKAYGLMALKVELKHLGYASDVQLNYQFGKAMDAAVKKFQADKGLIADGVVGPHTTRELFRSRIYEQEAAYDIPNHLTYRQTSLESAFDPGAFADHAENGVDRGLNQINSKAHPEVSNDQAYAPSFSIEWAASYLKSLIINVGDVDAGLAAYNIGTFYAKKWKAAGEPASGLFYPNSTTDYAKIATQYVSLIKNQSL